MSGAITVLIVDDDALVRAGLRLILGGAPDIQIIGEASDGAEAIEEVAKQRPDIVLMDIRMPRVDGRAATRRILAEDRSEGRLRPTRVVVLTTFDTDDLVIEALRIGATGFLLKDTRPEDIVGAVRAVAAGEPTLSPSVTAQLIARVSHGDPDRARRARTLLGRLTDREREVARTIGDGLTNAEIGQSLGMSLPTVKSHVSHLLYKLGADNRVQIALVVHDARAS